MMKDLVGRSMMERSWLVTSCPGTSGANRPLWEDVGAQVLQPHDVSSDLVTPVTGKRSLSLLHVRRRQWFAGAFGGLPSSLSGKPVVCQLA